VKAVYEIELDTDRTDMMAARESRGFTDYVRRIWSDLEVIRS
jgi:NitT/TauT family transport system ATP-binding protein